MLTAQTNPPARIASSPPPRASSAQMLLRHAREGSIVLRGPSTGQVYRFSKDAATAVLIADVDALLRTGALERVNR